VNQVLKELQEKVIATHEEQLKSREKFKEIGKLRHDFNDQITSITGLQQINLDSTNEHVKTNTKRIETLEDLAEHHALAIFGNKDLKLKGLVGTTSEQDESIQKLKQKWRDLLVGAAIVLYFLKTLGIIDKIGTILK